jgi:MFS transporter, SP family, sugar:H+ symporter
MGFALMKSDDVVGAAWPAILIGLFVAFGGVLFGYEYISLPLYLLPHS